jgi:hypothetical protein
MSHDDQLRKPALAEVSWDPAILAARIGVTVENGTTSLTVRIRTTA